MGYFDYQGLTVTRMVQTLDWKADGADRSFRERRWLPLALDGGGNLWILDYGIAPPRVRRWERAGRAASRPGQRPGELLAHLADELESGAHSLHRDSGTFDGPFVDLLARHR